MEKDSFPERLREMPDDALLQIIHQHARAYPSETFEAAQAEAKARGLLGQYGDATYKVIIAGDKESDFLDAARIKSLYLNGQVSDNSLVYVPSKKRWLFLSAVFDFRRWRAPAAVPPRIQASRPTPPSDTGAVKRIGDPTSPPQPSGYEKGPAPSAISFPNQQSSIHERAKEAVPGYTSPGNQWQGVPPPQPPLKTPDLRYKGIGGWLLLFILGQLVCRPLQTLGQIASGPNTALFTDKYPVTAFIIDVERVFMFGLALFGVIVAFTLMMGSGPTPVKIAKTYILSLLAFAIIDILLVSITDLPQDKKGGVIAMAFGAAIAQGIFSVIWYQYFKKSKRVYATYLAGSGSSPGGGDFTSLGIGR